ncbi:ZBED6 C-terminal-like protein [Plecturocebus cupreus]
MAEVEEIKKTPKRLPPSGSVGQEPLVCANSPVTRPKSSAATLACPAPELSTKATSTSQGLDCATREGLPTTEAKLKLVDRKKIGSGRRRKIRPSGSQKEMKRVLSLQRSSPCHLPSGTSILSPNLDQVFLEKQVESVLGPPVCSEKRKTRSVGRPRLHPPTSHAEHWSIPGPNKPSQDPGVCGLKPVCEQEPPVPPEKKVPRQKPRGCRKEGKQMGKKVRSLSLASGQAPSLPALVQTLSGPRQMPSPDRLEGNQSSESERVKQVDILTACLAREARHLQKWKKKHLLPGVREKSGPQPSLRKSPWSEKLARAVKAEPKGLGPSQRFAGSLHAAESQALQDMGQFFTIDCKNMGRAICTLCHTSVRQGKTKRRSQTLGLIRHLASKHGLEWARRATPASQGEGTRRAQEMQQKGSSMGPASLALGGLPSPRHCPEGSDRELAPGRPEQLLLAPPPLPASPAAVGDNGGGTCTPRQPSTQAWNHSITELLCSLALPLSIVSSRPFRRFMAQVDPCYCLPSPAFFSCKALPLLHEAVGEQVLQEMQWADGGRVHLAIAMAAQDSLVKYVAITAHWGVAPPGSGLAGGLRKRAVLWVRGLPLEGTVEDQQLEVLEQAGLWLGRGSLRAGFLISSGCPSLERAAKDEGYTHIPCFTHCLDSLVRNFLCHHHSVQIILDTARTICSHFQGSAEARGLLTQLQHQCGLPAHQPFEELSDHWASACHLLEWLVEQQQPLQEYEGRHQLGKAGTALSATFWSLADSLVKLLQPFQMAVREASAAQASLSQVLPQLRYLHIFLEQVHGYFQEQSVGQVGAAVRLAEGLALQLCTDCQLNELFYREEFVLATLLDPRFKGKIEAILPVGADIDHWKQVLVYKVKEIMVSEYSLTTPSPLQSPRVAKSPKVAGKSQGEHLQSSGRSGAFLLAQREKSLLERLESVGLLASKSSGGSLSTENHLASVIVKKYLRENETIGAQDDPLAYWEKKREAWPALARLATIYLSCPPTGAFSESVFASLNSPTVVEQNSSLEVEAIEHLLFLKTNLEHFPNYTPPPLVCSSGDLAEGEQSLQSAQGGVADMAGASAHPAVSS